MEDPEPSNEARSNIPNFSHSRDSPPNELFLRSGPEELPFSFFERAVLNSFADVFSTHASHYRALATLEARKETISLQRSLLKRIEQASDQILHGATPDDIVTALLRGISDVFGGSEVLFLAAKSGALVPSQSQPEALSTRLGKQGLHLQLRSECILSEDEAWNLGICKSCGECAGLTAIAALRNETIHVADTEAQDLARIYTDFGVQGTREEIAIPLRIGNSLLGVIDVYRATGDQLDKDSEYTLTTLCNTAALALLNKRLLQRAISIHQEEVKAEVARDVVHTLIPNTTSLQIEVTLLRKYLTDALTHSGKSAATRKSIENALEHLEKVDDFRRNQTNVFRTYEVLTSYSAGRIEPVNIQRVLDEVQQLNAFAAQKKQITFRRQTVGPPRTAVAAELDIYLILWNFINNGIKFTRGGRRTKIFLTDFYLPDVIRVTVRDQGVGIPRELITKIWDDQFSTKAPGAKAKTSGRGLFTVSQVAKKIPGGKYHASSIPGKGSEFMLEIWQRGLDT